MAAPCPALDKRPPSFSDRGISATSCFDPRPRASPLRAIPHYVGLLSVSGKAFLIKPSANPTNPWQTCTVVNVNDTMKGANVANVNVICTTTRYNVGGKVVGMGASKGLVISNNGANLATIDADSAFSVSLDGGTVYKFATVTQARPCNVMNPTGTVAGADITDVTVVCSRFLVVGPPSRRSLPIQAPAAPSTAASWSRSGRSVARSS